VPPARRINAHVTTGCISARESRATRAHRMASLQWLEATLRFSLFFPDIDGLEKRIY
jgi:hypothetical protein